MKILIADDDISTIDVLEKHIDWQSFGVTQVLRAYNGEVAMQRIVEERPELILCDIEMPLKSGLDVLRFFHDGCYTAEFSFLTAHESFEYARQAVRYGAVNYLTKPRELDEIHDELKKMVASALQKKAEKTSAEEASRPKEGTINHILYGLKDNLWGSDPERINWVFQQEGLPLTADSVFRIVTVCADVPPAAEEGTAGTVRQSIRYLAQETIAGRTDLSYLISDSGVRFEYDFLFLPAYQYTEQEIRENCDRFIGICQMHTQVSPVCLIGESIELQKTSQALGWLRQQAKSLRFEAGKSFHVRDWGTDQEAPPELDYEWNEASVLNAMKQHMRKEYLEEIEKCAKKILRNPHHRALKFNLLHHDILQTVYTCLRYNNILAHVVFRDGSLRQLDDDAERSTEDMICFAGALYDKAIDALAMVDGPEDIIGMVKKYIADHYRENIDRDSLASIAYITPNYLSKLFRMQTGTSLREYINNLRIQEAKRLLLTTNASITDIALDMGFENISYFSTVFRKFCGCSPIEWRNQKDVVN